MKKIEIYYGSTGTFLKSVPKSHKNLTTLALECDVDAKKQEIVVRGQNEKPIKTVRRKRKISCLVAAATEYCAVQEHVISNFLNFIQQFSIQNIYIQNPPQKIADQLIAYYGDSIVSIVNESYGNVTEVKLKEISDDFDEKIIGQGYVKNELLQALYPATQEQKRNKPITVLFYGSSGVGKTEVAKTLAQELGIELVRFDMSEYTEKHAVAKLIGSPAGYVGYDDGGLLTSAIRKTPNCVLLLDEIEKAHQDIYNILLQVMDYAKLTDNKGHKADFHNVIIIMTSNAGAQYAGQASIGFNSSVSRGEAMLKQVKKTFKPEFINRLSGTVVFRDMDKDMAVRILNKKLSELQTKLDSKSIKMTLSEEAFEFILNEGFVPEYGAREMDRVIAQRLKPMLMREILFGSLIKGGDVEIVLEKEELKIKK